jgi:hypothetical protein
MSWKAARWAAAAVLVLAAWVAISAALAFRTEPGRSLAVFAPPGRVLAVVVAAGGLPLQAGGAIAIARSDAPDFVAQLYDAGALLVVDARRAGGCIDLTKLVGPG